MTDQIHRAKINKSNYRTNTQNEDKQVELQYLFCHSTCLSSLCVFILSFDLFIFILCICSVIRLVYLRSVYLFCHLTCLSSLCVLVRSFDLFIFAVCICYAIWLVCLRSVYLLSRMTEQIHRAKINKSNDRTNTQNEDKQVEWQNKYTERR
jgi:predicted membrane protein